MENHEFTLGAILGLYLFIVVISYSEKSDSMADYILVICRIQWKMKMQGPLSKKQGKDANKGTAYKSFSFFQGLCLCLSLSTSHTCFYLLFNVKMVSY